MTIKKQLNEQLNGEHAIEARQCIEIYDALLTLEGRVWNRTWDVLVRCVRWSEHNPYYVPSRIGKVFIDGLNKYKNIEL